MGGAKGGREVGVVGGHEVGGAEGWCEVGGAECSRDAGVESGSDVGGALRVAVKWEEKVDKKIADAAAPSQDAALS